MCTENDPIGEEEIFKLKPIGIVKSPITQMSPGNWGNVTSEIQIFDAYKKGLRGLEEFSHIIVVFYMNLASFDPSKDMLRHPRGRKNLPELGVFAQRTKYRPNLIGVSSVKIMSIKDNILTVKGLDALNRTPILDIKPYMPMFDTMINVKTPNWVEKFEEGYF